MYKIECSGSFRESRNSIMLESFGQQHREEPDLCLLSSDGVTLPSHRCLLTLHSEFLAELLSTIPCCISPSISLPFSGNELKNLLAVLSSGVSLSLSKEELLNVQRAADLLSIKLTNLKVERNNKVIHLRVDGDSTIQDLYHQVTGLPRPAVNPLAKLQVHQEPKPFSPKPYDQNDNDNDDYEDNDNEVVEVTPEIFGGGFAPHFLMEAQYGDNSNDTYSSGGGWMDDQESTRKPELIELGEGEGKTYGCSFCPNKVFKKKPEVLRHFQKHIPLSQRKRFQCERCKEKFISNSNLKTHMKVCTGVVKMLVCKRCKAEFDNKTDYEDHLAEAHNTGRKHECSICHKQLRRASDVRKHMLTHSEGKPFGCDICGKKFRTESYVKIHKQAHYNNGATFDNLRSEPDDNGNSTIGDDDTIGAITEEEIEEVTEEYNDDSPEAAMTPDDNDNAMTPESSEEATGTDSGGEIITPDLGTMMTMEEQQMLGAYSHGSILA